MKSIDEVLRSVNTLTFDCYGTLIDGRRGLSEFFAELLVPAAVGRTDELFDRYVRVEAKIEGGAYRTYREVLSVIAVDMARQFDADLPPDRAGVLAEMLPNWALFADTNDALSRLKSRYRLGVLSNVDRDLFAGTARHLDVEFDFVVTAQDVRSYKPAHGHFERLLLAHGRRDEVLHVAQSLFHDGVPTGRLGIPFVWINRYGEVNETHVRPLAEYSNLDALAAAASV